jgi:CubicO group peptidase (beta-lactamase class C family)
MDENLPSKKIIKSGKPFVFPRIKNIELPQEFQHNGNNYNILEYIDSSYTQGFLIIKNDTILYENYWRGQNEDIQHISWSMAKSYVSALFGIAIEEGYIKSIDQTVDVYLPELKGSGYEGVMIKDVLQMSSGVKFDETQDKFAATLVNERTPGTFNRYVSIDTHVLGMIIVKATGRSLTDYLQEKIWEPIGAEFEAYWLVDGKDMEMANGGLNACLRDYAKFGRIYLNKGNWNGEQIIPLSWFEESTNSSEEHLQPESKNSESPGLGYGYQWWLPDGTEDEILAIGIFNQYIYVNPTTNTVIVKNSANKNYYDKSNPYRSHLVHLELFRKIAHADM